MWLSPKAFAVRESRPSPCLVTKGFSPGCPQLAGESTSLVILRIFKWSPKSRRLWFRCLEILRPDLPLWRAVNPLTCLCEIRAWHFWILYHRSARSAPREIVSAGTMLARSFTWWTSVSSICFLILFSVCFSFRLSHWIFNVLMFENVRSM